MGETRIGKGVHGENGLLLGVDAVRNKTLMLYIDGSVLDILPTTVGGVVGREKRECTEAALTPKWFGNRLRSSDVDLSSCVARPRYRTDLM